MHIADDVLARHDEHQRLGSEADGFLLHRLGNPHTAIFGAGHFALDDTHIDNLEVLCTLDGVGVHVGQDTRDVAGNDPGIGISLTDLGVDVVGRLDFEDTRTRCGCGGLDILGHGVGELEFLEAKVGEIVGLAYITTKPVEYFFSAAHFTFPFFHNVWNDSLANSGIVCP